MTIHKTRGLLAVRADAGDAKAALAELTTEAKAFRQRYDGRMKAVEDGLAAIGAGIELGAGYNGGAPSAPLADVNAALRSFIRDGDETGLAGVRASMSVDSQPDGGYTVIPHFSDSMTKIVWESSPIRRLARVVNVSSDAFEEVVDRDEAAATWVGERQARPATDTPQLGMLRIPVHEIYAAPRVTQKLLDDSSINIAAWLSDKVANKFARSEATATVLGDGQLKPRGFLTYPTAATGDDDRAWGTLEHVNTGASGAFASSDPGDALIDLTYTLKAAYRPGAVFLMNRKTAALTRKLKDGDGNYLWQRSTQAGEPDLLLGFPVHYGEDMPDVAANSMSIAFGNFRAGYTLVDRHGIRVLRDALTDKPHTVFYTYKRVGGDVNNFEAIKLLRFGS